MPSEPDDEEIEPWPDEGAGTTIPTDGADRKAQSDTWGAFSLIVAGVAVWGGVGYVVSRWLNNTIFVMLGLLLGTGTALYGVWNRYGRF
jgi:hypothetical protein